MRITGTRVKARRVLPTAGGPVIQVAPTVHLNVPAMRCRAVLLIAFPAPALSARAGSAEIACGRALMMLGPAYAAA